MADRGESSDQLVDALVQSAFLTVAVLSRVGAERELSLTQMRVLGILRDRRLRMTVLADYLGLEKSTLSGLVARAEARGLVERSVSTDDRRVTEVFLSKHGLKLANEIHGQVVSELASQISAVPPPARPRLASLLMLTMPSPDEA